MAIEKGEGTLTNAARILVDGKTDMTNGLNQMNSKLDVLDAQWKGQGGTAFAQAKQSLTTNRTKVLNAIDTFEKALKDTDVDFDNTDVEAAGKTKVEDSGYSF